MHLRKIVLIVLLLGVIAGCNFFWGVNRWSITGKVMTTTGVPIRGVHISTIPPTSPTITDTQGRFVIYDVKEGNYEVVASSQGFQNNSSNSEIKSRFSYSCYVRDSYIEIYLTSFRNNIK